MRFGITEITISQKTAVINPSYTIKRYLESLGIDDGLGIRRKEYKGSKNGF